MRNLDPSLGNLAQFWELVGQGRIHKNKNLSGNVIYDEAW